MSIFSKFTQRVKNTETVEKYMAVPKKDRQYFGWYLKPYAMRYDGSKPLLSEFDKLDDFLKKEYPIQFWVRESFDYVIGYKRTIRDWWYYKVACRINPRQKWLTKIIPNTWYDKDHLMEITLFEMVKHFVDGEKCFEKNDYSETISRMEFSENLHECYDFITKHLSVLEKEMMDAYPPLDDSTTFEQRIKMYEKIDALEKAINEEKTKWLVWIVTNRHEFWT